MSNERYEDFDFDEEVIEKINKEMKDVPPVDYDKLREEPTLHEALHKFFADVVLLSDEQIEALPNRSLVTFISVTRLENKEDKEPKDFIKLVKKLSKSFDGVSVSASEQVNDIEEIVDGEKVTRREVGMEIILDLKNTAPVDQILAYIGTNRG